MLILTSTFFIVKLHNFDYHLPDNLIARYPTLLREGSRLLVIHRDKGKYEDRIFPDILEYLLPGDALILNETRVIPARLSGRHDAQPQRFRRNDVRRRHQTDRRRPL